MRRRRSASLRALLLAALSITGCSLGPVDLNDQKPLPLRSTVHDATGGVLARLYKENRSPIGLGRVPDHVVDAVLAAEDKDFFEHPGYDLRAMTRALVVNLREGEIVQGGSTITQQYVKNTFFRRPSRSFERKARELRLSIEVERVYSKKEILERYLNTVYLGEGAYGIEAASETYFGHGVRHANLVEGALLAALIKAPSYYNPYRHAQRAARRRDYVLDRMVINGALRGARATTAKRTLLGVLEQPPKLSAEEPYFVEAVRQEIIRDHRFGPNPDARDRFLHEGGLRIETTLVPSLQRAARRAIDRVLDERDDPEAAIVVLRPQTGEVVAMIGGRDWSASQVNLATGSQGGGSGRQPGSAFKPIVAAAALEAGIPMTAKYESAPATFDLGEGEFWKVSNAEGSDYGELTLEEGLVRSVNGVYARLTLELGANQVASQASVMGIRSRLPAYPSIALGSAEVSVMDMAAAYATIANGGTAVEPTTINRVITPEGEVHDPDQQVVESAISPGNAYLLTKTLEEVILRGTGYGASIGRPAAGKTGTTDDYADAWFVGFTPQLVTAVWVGYPHARIPMTSVHGIRVMGGTFPAQIWREFMLAAHANLPVKDFEVPSGELVTVTIDPKTGLLAAPWCPGKEKTMLRQLAPTELCPLPPPEPPPSPIPEPSPSPSKTPKEDKDERPEPKPSPPDDDEKTGDKKSKDGGPGGKKKPG